MKAYFVYIVTNKARTVLYTGVTHSLVVRVSQHRRGETPGFTQRYNVNRLMYIERFNAARDAISREKQIKGWTRAKKEALIAEQNPEWEDLADLVLGLGSAAPVAWQATRGWGRAVPRRVEHGIRRMSS